ncbi:MAG: pseudouridine synthase [Steroidobacteraceae bacterium]
MPSPPKHSVASTLQLPPGRWTTVLDCLCDHFDHISREQWLSRMARGRVLDQEGKPVAFDSLYRVGQTIRYFREVAAEQIIPFAESIVYADANIVVADKPHFLPVTPKGEYVTQCLLARLIERLDAPQLAPLHRIDRGTAGLVMFSINPKTRAQYHALFSGRNITKHYQAIAPALPMLEFPLTHRSCMVSGEPFFRMQEVTGVANSETHIDVLERGAVNWRYALSPITGKKHQLRVHMVSLGAGILNDDFYPALTERVANDYSRPLKLLAARLEFVDPVSGAPMRFTSSLSL